MPPDRHTTPRNAKRVRKTRDRRRKVTVERSDIVYVDNGRVQQATEDDALRGNEILKGVYVILALEHTDDAIGKLLDVMCRN